MPPRAIVIAERTALLPPVKNRQPDVRYERCKAPYFRYDLRGHEHTARITNTEAPTDDKVDLRAKVEREILVAHELVHLDLLNDTKLGNALNVKFI